MSDMANTAIDDRASAEQVREHADELRAAAHEIGVTDVRLLDNGVVVVHSDDPGYRHVIALVGRARDIVGSYVHVITDDVPAAVGAPPL
jgi:hypothetical protein